MRLACVFVPQLALQSVLRREPESRGFAIALFERAPSSPHARVIAATDEARRGGVRNGMTGAQAGAACPTLRKVCATAADVATAQAALGDLGFAFAPRIDTSGLAQGRIFFEIGDLERLYHRGRGGDRAGDPGARGAAGPGRARRDRVVEGDRARGDARARAGGGPARRRARVSGAAAGRRAAG